MKCGSGSLQNETSCLWTLLHPSWLQFCSVLFNDYLDDGPRWSELVNLQTTCKQECLQVHWWGGWEFTITSKKWTKTVGGESVTANARCWRVGGGREHEGGRQPRSAGGLTQAGGSWWPQRGAAGRGREERRNQFCGPFVDSIRNEKLKFAGRRIQVLHYQETLKTPGKQGHGKARGGIVSFPYVSLLSTAKLLTAELFPIVDSLVHPNWFQATASCFSDWSGEISAQSSVSMTAKLWFCGEGNTRGGLNQEPFGSWNMTDKH